MSRVSSPRAWSSSMSGLQMAATSPLSARTDMAEPDPAAAATSAPTVGPISTGPTNMSLLNRTSASITAAHPSPTPGSPSRASTAANKSCRSTARCSRGSNPPADTSRASSFDSSLRAPTVTTSEHCSVATRRATVSRSIHTWISVATAPAARDTACTARVRSGRRRRPPRSRAGQRSTRELGGGDAGRRGWGRRLGGRRRRPRARGARAAPPPQGSRRPPRTARSRAGLAGP
jgi:hypothetical protein